jgi:hypothetical protein
VSICAATGLVPKGAQQMACRKKKRRLQRSSKSERFLTEAQPQHVHSAQKTQDLPMSPKVLFGLLEIAIFFAGSHLMSLT